MVICLRKIGKRYAVDEIIPALPFGSSFVRNYIDDEGLIRKSSYKYIMVKGDIGVAVFESMRRA